MSTAVATFAGAAALLAVLLLGHLARPAATRVPAAPAPAAAARRSPSRRRLAGLLVAAFCAGAGVAALGPVPLAVAAAAAVLLRHRRRRRVEAGRVRDVEAAMPDAVELLVLCIHAGCSPTQAVVTVAARAPPAVRPMFAEVELGMHRGRSLADALGALTVSGALGREVAAAMAAADRDGLPLAPVLDRLAVESRAARRRLGDADARRLPVRLTVPLVVCTLPAFVLLAIAPAVLGALSTLRANAP